MIVLGHIFCFFVTKKAALKVYSKCFEASADYLYDNSPQQLNLTVYSGATAAKHGLYTLGHSRQELETT